MLTDVSDHLGNTPAVARASYVDPRVITQYENGHTIRRTITRTGSDNLNRASVRARLERSVARLLS